LVSSGSLAVEARVTVRARNFVILALLACSPAIGTTAITSSGVSVSGGGEAGGEVDG